MAKEKVTEEVPEVTAVVNPSVEPLPGAAKKDPITVVDKDGVTYITLS